jgi:hypothetical protein
MSSITVIIIIIIIMLPINNRQCRWQCHPAAAAPN